MKKHITVSIICRIITINQGVPFGTPWFVLIINNYALINVFLGQAIAACAAASFACGILNGEQDT